jgi:hypothetical protein
MMRWTLALPFVLVACGNAVAQTDRPKVPADLPFHPDLKTPPVPEPKPAAEAAPPIATPAPAPGKAALPFPIVPPVLDRVWFDAPGDGAVWAVGRTYKAAFTADGAVYHPFFGPRAPRHFPVTFALAGLRRGGVPLAVPGTSVPSRDGERILYDRGAALEVYEPRLEGVEQSFVIHDLPGAGALEVLVGVRTELAASDDTEGLRFEGAFGHVRYGKATAFDAAGASVEVPATLEDGAIRLTVPEAFLARAAFPVTIDPLVSTHALQGVGEIPGYPDSAYDHTTNRYFVIWGLYVNPTDVDLVGQFYNADGSLVPGTLTYVDATSQGWYSGRVANNNLANQFLVVAARGLNPDAIWGRTVSATFPVTQSAQFQISGPETGVKDRPDVGGDPLLQGPTYYCVVWRRVFDADDTDIHARLVRTNATLHGPGTILIDNSGATEDEDPAISPSDGNGPFATQDWTIVWQRRFGFTDIDVRGARVHWDGAITAPSFSIAATTSIEARPFVSTITDPQGGVRRWLVVYSSSRVPSAIYRAVGRVYSGTTPVTPTVDLGALEGIPTDVSAEPVSAETDGCRFSVVYRKLPPGQPRETNVATYHLTSAGSLGLTEGQVQLDSWPALDLSPGFHLTSTRSSGGGPSRYFIAWTRSLGPGPFPSAGELRGALYDGWSPTGGHTSLPTACGGLPLQASGVPALGEPVAYRVNNVTGQPALILGLPAPPYAPFCPSCLLGVQLAGSVVIAGPLFSTTIACEPALIGVTVAIQGVDFNSAGGCAQPIPFRLSNTILITHR